MDPVAIASGSRASQAAGEAALLLACMRGVAFEVPPDTNWNAFERLAANHGVLLLLDRALREAHIDPPGSFGEAVKAAALRASRLSHSLESLLGTFDERGIEVLPLKGPVLAQTLYGDASLRHSSDLDLLVHGQDFVRAEALLFERGFCARRPSNYDRLFTRDGLSVELHSRIASPQYCSFDVDGIWSRSHAGSFRGMPIRRMSNDDLMLYLCAHGLKHGFSRLIWILDLAHALRGCGRSGYERLMTHAEQHGMTAWLLVGCEVVRTVLPQSFPRELEPAIAERPAAANRARRAAERIVAGDSPAVADHRDIYLLAEPSLMRRWRYRLRFFTTTPSDRRWAEHHRVAQGLAVVARPFRLLHKYGPSRLWYSLFPPAA